MDRKIGIYEVKTETNDRQEGGFVADWSATWTSEKGKREWRGGECGVFDTAVDAKVAADAAAEEWCQANPVPPR